MQCFTDKPSRPVVSSDLSDPTDGQDVTLFCTTTTSEVNSYEFFKDGNSLSSGSNNTLLISSATIDTHDGVYTCVAYIDTVASESSDLFYIQCEYLLVFSTRAVHMPWESKSCRRIFWDYLKKGVGFHWDYLKISVGF